jgi:hypothetical protein
MTPQLDAFLEELRADPRFAPVVDDVEEAASAISEGDDLGDALEFYEALTWIARQPRSVEARLAAMQKIGELKGKVHIPSLRDFLGWDA